ncbi:hypothetical protein ANN_11398 [Periplaneta americana]|uniref:Mos1 transposase HTH domain-containing protein n=1 Tax=Periplaneta americana TaxID=6978 RepID=A0ABQ8T6K8_PERAM|nr:hypothetical protein ANN_11398 [Periplaneta americana]
MGGRGKDSMFEQRQSVVFHHARGKSYRYIANILQMKKSTVADIVQRYSEMKTDVNQCESMFYNRKEQPKASAIPSTLPKPTLVLPLFRVVELSEINNRSVLPLKIRTVIWIKPSIYRAYCVVLFVTRDLIGLFFEGTVTGFILLHTNISNDSSRLSSLRRNVHVSAPYNANYPNLFVFSEVSP